MQGASRPLSRKLALPLALAGTWLLTSVGVFLFLHSDQWWFIGLGGYDAATIGQIGTFYLCWAAVQLPAAAFLGMIIGSSDFTHPLCITFLTAVGYHFFFSAIRAARWPWTALHGLDQSIPVLAYLVSTALLIGVSVFHAWLMPKWYKLGQRYFGH